MTRRYRTVVSLCLLMAAIGRPCEAALKTVSRDPYVGAIVVDCATGKVIFEDRADAPAYPASILKIMGLLLMVEYVEQGKATLGEKITTTAEAARTGGSQVYLKEHEVFILDDMLYAMMIQSANDVAVALAVHYAGSKVAFVERMNRRAAELGMKDTIFRSVHGLPPGPGQKPDITTARDMARLGMEVVKHPLALKYTSATEKGFRDNKFKMRTHNNLLGVVEGCDGLKTGYIRAAGFSIVATAQRDGRRIVAAVLGSKSKTVRDKKAKELIAQGFLNLPALGEAAPAEAEEAGAGDERPVSDDTPVRQVSRGTWVRGTIIAAAIIVLFGVSRRAMKKKFEKYEFY